MNQKSETVARLRDLVPLRPLTHIEALRVAELQATRLLRLAGITEPPVPDTVITTLPRIQVARVPLGGTQGGTQWSQGRWIILINGTDVSGRQRFSLFHEFKHILDNPFIDLLYPDQPGSDGEEWSETICEWFAASALMPRSWVKRAFAQQRIQSVKELTRLFDVSAKAMRIRLTQLDFIAPVPRCSYRRPAVASNHKEDRNDYLTAARRAA